MARCVILWHHSIPPAAGLGGDHFDWMFEDPSHPERGLITFRVAEAMDLQSLQSFTATRNSDHRREYLDFEGDLTGSRGNVTRVHSGECLSVTERPGELEVVIRFDGQGEVEHRFYGKQERSGWHFSVEAADASDAL